MFDLERAIADWKKGMRRSASIEEADLAELERYVRDKVEDLVRGGEPPEAAFRAAEAEFRRAPALEAAYGDTRARRPRGRFPWRPRRFETGLLRSHVRLVLRRLRLQTAHSVINIGGLALGLTGCLLAFLWVREERSFDRFQERAPDIAQVYVTFRQDLGPGGVFNGSFYPLAAALESGCPEVEDACRIQVETGLSIRVGDRIFDSDRIALADPSIFKVLTFRFLRGSPETAFAGPFSAVLTRSMARRYFGDDDPVGRSLHVNGQFDIQVGGVVEDLPRTSSFRIDGIVPFVVQFAPDFKEPDHWGGNPFQTWALLAPGSDRRAVEAKIDALVAPLLERAQSGVKVRFRLNPLLRSHLYSPGEYDLGPLLALFCAGALFVLALAGINFTNLSTARAATRTREIGIRKTVGAGRLDLVRQLLGESVATALLALVAAVGLAALALPLLNRIARTAISVGAVLRFSTLAGFLAIAVAAGLAAGAYPAFVLSSLGTRTVLAGRPGRGLRPSGVLRKGLIVFQFALSLVLVTVTVVVGRQVAFVRAKDPGFVRTGLVAFRPGPALRARFGALREELLRIPGVEGVAASLQNPNNIGSTVNGADWAGKEPGRNVTLNWDYVAYDYFETLKATFAAGRPFSRAFPSDAQGAFVINETAAKLMGLRDPVGTKLRVFKAEGPIVGVVRDFHYRPLRAEIGPIVFRLRPGVSDWAYVRIAPGSAGRALPEIAAAVRRADPDTLFKAEFLEDLMMKDQYAVEGVIWTISRCLSGTALFIACIGLLGLSSFLTQRRTKEIGIRKVMGATSSRLAVKLVREFLAWVGLAVGVGLPVAVLAAGKLLSLYAYRAPAGPVLYALTGAAMLALAALTVGAHALRVARSNPVDSLRYE